MNILADTDAGIHLGWYGLGTSSPLAPYPGFGPSGVGSLWLALDHGFTVTMEWPTDIIKHAAGTEQRIRRNDRPLESYSGQAYLSGTEGAALRSVLAQHAATGLPFLLGLPHEALALRANASGATVYVGTTAFADWLNPGQRVIVARRWNGTSQHITAVVQGKTADSIALDVAPGDIGKIGGVIMPAVPVLLDPEQSFPRYRTNVERWSIRALAASLGFAPTRASLALGPITTHAGLEAATLTARNPGTDVSVRFWDTGSLGIVEGSNTIILFSPGVTTIAEVKALLDASSRVIPTGTWGAGVLTAGDAFALTPLTGGDEEGPVGTGAAITTYAGLPLWDRRIDVRDTNTDSIHAMTSIIQHGAARTAIGTADAPDFGRAVVFRGKRNGLDWQWLKLFLATVKGQAKAFYLPTWRDDLPFVSKAANTITVRANVPAWWPTLRQHVQIVEASGTITRAEVTAIANNGDGTFTLTIGTTIATSSVLMVSWLERSRFERPEFSVSFGPDAFELSTTARTVRA